MDAPNEGRPPGQPMELFILALTPDMVGRLEALAERCDICPNAMFLAALWWFDTHGPEDPIDPSIVSEMREIDESFHVMQQICAPAINAAAAGVAAATGAHVQHHQREGFGTTHDN